MATSTANPDSIRCLVSTCVISVFLWKKQLNYYDLVMFLTAFQEASNVRSVQSVTNVPFKTLTIDVVAMVERIRPGSRLPVRPALPESTYLT